MLKTAHWVYSLWNEIYRLTYDARIYKTCKSLWNKKKVFLNDYW